MHMASLKVVRSYRWETGVCILLFDHQTRHFCTE